MKKAIVFLFVLMSGSLVKAQKHAVATKQFGLMGCGFEVTAVADNDTTAWQAINVAIEEMTRIEKLISSWDPRSQTSEVVRMGGLRPVKVDKELFDLVKRAKKVSALTDGAFDISYASMDRIWTFDGKEQGMPDTFMVAKARQFINWRNIILDPEKQTIFLKYAGMKIGFGAIGKGYAANKAKAKMMAIPGVKGGVVNASGDLIAWGVPAKPEGWKVKIADPKDKSKAIAWLGVNNASVVTSGDYERFFTCKGKRYAHIIDPRTGWPTSGIKSVTVICPDPELADALATSIFVLGQTKGLGLVNRLKSIECLIVTDDDKIVTSKNLKINYY